MRRENSRARPAGAVFFVSVCLLLASQISKAQELEPRRWTSLPVGANFASVGYAYTDGNATLDPAVLIEDFQGELHTVALGYLRALDVLGKSGRIQFVLPYSNGRWEGTLNGAPESTRRSGFGDPRVRFAVNLFGAPALAPAEFAKFTPKTVVGVALNVSLPFGENKKDKLVNLGGNRWIFRLQTGVTHQWGKWAAELSGSAWFFTENDDFFGGQEREQDPFFTLQGHIVYTFRPGLWASAGVGMGGGGESTIDGVFKSDRQRKGAYLVSFGVPINRRQGIKLAYLNVDTRKDLGGKYDSLVLGYSVMWGKGL